MKGSVVQAAPTVATAGKGGKENKFAEVDDGDSRGG